MKQRKGIVCGLAVLAMALHPLGAEAQSLNISGTAGGAGLAGEVQPQGAASLSYTHSDAMGRGHIFSAVAGIGYAALGYGVPTPVGLIMAQTVFAPIATEYREIEDGREARFAMDAPLYRAGIGLLIPTAAVTVSASSAVELRNWQTTSSLYTAPADRIALDNTLDLQYRVRNRPWSTNRLAADAGWTFSGRYRSLFRPGYQEWGAANDRITHDGAAQQQVVVGGALVLPVGGDAPWAAVGMAMQQEWAVNPYRRDRPRYGQPQSPQAVGVSGYAPESLPGETVNAATLSVDLPVGEAMLLGLRFDWLHRHDDAEDERRGVGASVQALVGNAGRFDLALGVAVNPHEGVDLPLAGSLTWSRNINLGGNR